MIRVCHVQVLSIMSGVQRSMLEIFKHLDRDRYEPHVACKEPGPLTEELHRLDIPVHYLPALDRPIHPRDYSAYRQMRQLLEREQFHIVHTHSSKPGLLGRLAATHAGTPAIVHHVRAFAFHEHSSALKKLVYGQLEKWAARRCHRMIFVNREERELVVRRGWAPPEDCVTIYNGVDLQAVHPLNRLPVRETWRKQHGFTPNEMLAVFVGRLDYPKQPLLLADIAWQLEQLRPGEAWRLVIAGTGGDEPALRRKADALGIAHRLAFLGWQESAFDALHACDVSLLTSLAEGLPRSLIESQAAGLPIVASNAKGNREVVTEKSGFLCAPRDAGDYARRLVELLDSEPLREEMGIAAREHAEQCFDTIENNRRIIDVYDELTEHLRPAVPYAPSRLAA